MNLAFALLAHDQPSNVARLVDRLTAQGAFVALHWDARNATDLVATLTGELPADQAARLIPARRTVVEWGMWSVVGATLNCLDALHASGKQIDYVTLLSGHDYPLRPLQQLRAFLEEHGDTDHIECVDHKEKKWVTTGLHDERWQYRHFFNWRESPNLFNACWKSQSWLGLARQQPPGCKPHFGSQWWTLRWSTLEKIRSLCADGKIMRFFRRTWVPDELFFQSLVAAAVPREQIRQRNLTFYHFDRRGRPLVFYNDHGDFLEKQPYFFARKISPRATKLRDHLDGLAESRRGTKPPALQAGKILEPFESFDALQKKGFINRRLWGRVKDPVWAEMDRNHRAYTAIIAPRTTNLQDVWRHFAAQPGKLCYGDLFEPGSIGYGEHAGPHPMYPPSSPALRDMSPAGFLFDLLQQNPDRHAVFSLRIPSASPILHVLVYDPNCELVFVKDEPERNRAKKPTDWQAANNERILADLSWVARKEGKRPAWLAPGTQETVSCGPLGV